MSATALYMACRIDGCPRFVPEICSLCFVEKKKMSECYIKMKKYESINDTLPTVTLNTLDVNKSIVTRWVNSLELKSENVDRLIDKAYDTQKLARLTLTCLPTSLIAGSIYYACRKLKIDNVTAEMISNISACSKSTIKKTCLSIHDLIKDQPRVK
jgi:transcription initiation factor TFIIIB Brf1 subunit/transcription initiation factor TFIIB